MVKQEEAAMSAKRGFMLMNIGSPDEPSTQEIRNFLKEIEREDVVDLPWALRSIVKKSSKGDISELREAYQATWSGNMSPMVRYCTRLTSSLQERINDPVVLGMAYGHPSYKGAIETLLENNVTEICVLPLFAQYALATVGSCVARVKHELKHLHSGVTLRVASPFYNHDKYIEAIAASLNVSDEHVLFNYHGYPLRHLKKANLQCEHQHRHCLSSGECCATPSFSHGSCYRFQCLATSREISRAAGLEENGYSTAFQSHTDNEKWMAPYTDATLRLLPAKGMKRLAVVCPALFCDCFETFEEIGTRGRETFLEAGGESFRIIPSLNDSPAAIQCLESLMVNADSWPTAL